MKPNKGLFIDTRPIEQPEGTYPYGKNGIQFDIQGSIYNEPGFKKLLITLPYRFMGVIETDSIPVVFSTDNISSAIGFLDVVNEIYTPIVDDATWTLTNADGSRARLGFQTSNYITGQFQKNYKDETVVAFTDKTLVPRYLNCTNPNLKSINDLRLFPIFSTPQIQVIMGSGGSLAAGAYYVAIGYERRDGTSTQYSPVSNVTTVTSGTVPGTSDKLLQVIVNNVDTNYDFLRVAIISKIAGVINTIELTSYIPIAGNTTTFTFSGAELFSTIDISQVLTPTAVYDKVDKIGQLNDYLYLGGLHEEPDLDDMQSYAAQVKLEWVSELTDAINPPTEHIQGKKKSFQHEEVYAYYLRYRKTRGGFSKWFVTVGPSLPSTFFSSEAQAGGMGQVPNYKVDDNIPYNVGFTGGFGPYYNDTEKYPDTIEFDLTSFGGENLRGTPVRHHRTPSQRWCKKNLYSSVDDYGRSKLDLLGVRALNVKIPDKYKNIIDGYEIGYAVRTIGNMTNYGQSTLFHGITDYYNNPNPGGPYTTPTSQASIYTSGGNYRMVIYKGHGAFGDTGRQLAFLKLDTFRMHPFDVLFNLPSIQPDYISGQFKLRRNNLNDASIPTPNPTNPPPPKNYVEDGDVSGNNTGPLEYIVDFTTGEKPIPQPTGSFLRKITSSFYCPNNVNVNNFVNGRHETAFCGYLGGNNWAMADTLSQGMGLDYDNGNTHSNRALQFEEAYMVNLMAIKADIYNNFYSQNLTSAGDTINITDTTTPTLWGGDVFISAYTFHTYGRYNSLDEQGDGIKGVKMVRRIVCESVSNINLRFVDPANQYSDFWPRTPIVSNDIKMYLTLFDRSQDPNQFGYDKSFNALNDLIDSTIWSPFQEYLYDFPYRIHRGGKASRTGRPRSWRTFLALDYYEMIKNMGRIVNLEGMDDRLIIHMENAMFLTQDKSKLESNLISITLGAGDIFQFEPQESLSSKLGYAGTQHDLACVRTPFGYIFVDAKIGEIYLYKQKLSVINDGLNTFLRDFLKLPDKNTYVGNGITIGWDQKYKRILLTVKNKQLPDGTTIIPFQDTDSFWNSLTPGQIVSYQGRYIQYMGPNSTSYQCPPDPIQQIVTWQPTDQYCVLDANGKTTGIVAYNNRIRLINGTVDGYKEPNTAQGLGTYFQPVFNPGICPPTPPVITWQGSNGVCLKNDVPTCNAGYNLSDDKTLCLRTQTQPATPPSGGTGTAGIAQKVNSNQWNNGGIRYIAHYNLDGSPVSPTTDVTLVTTPHFFVNGTTPFNSATRNTVDGRMNVAGIWVQGGVQSGNLDWTPVQEFIGFSRKFTVSSARTVLVMMCADNNFKINVNGATLVDMTSNNGNLLGAPNFAYANVYPVQMRSGDNYIEMYAENFGNVAGFAAEIYDITLSQLQAATSEADLHLLFSTRDVIGQNFDLGISTGYSCPDGWSFDPVNVVCVKTDSQTPSSSEGDVNNGDFAFNTRCRVSDGILDGYCETNTTDGTGQGPYLPPVPNPACLPVTPPTPGEITIVGNVQLNCTISDCSANGYASLFFTPSSGVWPTQFRLLIAMVINRNNTTPQYVGSDLIGSIPGGTVANPDYVVNGANVPLAAQMITNNDGTPISTSSPITQLNDVSGGQGVWLCNNCTFPVTDIWIKIDPTSLDPADPNTYALNFTNTFGITIHNL